MVLVVNLVGGGRISGMNIQLPHKFEDIISLENLLLAWQEFLCGKKKRLDVQVFSARFMDNILSLHQDLLYHNYYHGPYQAFSICDPKPRNIHKAGVRDRLLHRALYRLSYPFFDRIFISDSYFCRNGKGTHKAINRFRKYFYKVSCNNTRNCWVLKGDIRKFFASIDHNILLGILNEYISDKDIVSLWEIIISSFNSGEYGKGLPLGNLSSQLLANIYLNKFDQFIKHNLKIRYYIRYADDFLILLDNKDYLKELVDIIKTFLEEELKLELHPKKLFIKTVSSGLDFLGWVNFPEHRVFRTVSKRRMFRKLNNNYKEESFISYLGLLSHGNAKKLQKLISANFY